MLFKVFSVHSKHTYSFLVGSSCGRNLALETNTNSEAYPALPMEFEERNYIKTSLRNLSQFLRNQLRSAMRLRPRKNHNKHSLLVAGAFEFQSTAFCPIQKWASSVWNVGCRDRDVQAASRKLNWWIRMLGVCAISNRCCGCPEIVRVLIWLMIWIFHLNVCLYSCFC